MNAITNDMQRLGEAVSILACGTGTIQSRLADAFVPLSTLQFGAGTNGKGRSAELAHICSVLTNTNILGLSVEDARDIASAIVDLQNAVWYDAVWALEDTICGQ